MKSEDVIEEIAILKRKILGSKWSFREVYNVSKALEDLDKTAIYCYDRGKDDKAR